MTHEPADTSFAARLTAPQPIERLAILRIFAPLMILGFLSTRMIHGAHWLGNAGFRVPELLPAPYSQPMYLPGLGDAAAWGMVGLTAISGLLTALGLGTRAATAVFACCLVYVAWADRLAAFSVNKLGAVLMIALVFTPAGARWSLDALRRRRRRATPVTPTPVTPVTPVTHVSWGNVRFFQVLLVLIYCASGIAKAQGDWLSHDFVLWTHLHDSYQTPISRWLANNVPPRGWTISQYLVLVFEIGAPLLFGLRKTRPIALGFCLLMHLGIGLCFGPVVWFALLMIVVLVACFLPERLLRGGHRRRLPATPTRDAPPPTGDPPPS